MVPHLYGVSERELTCFKDAIFYMKLISDQSLAHQKTRLMTIYQLWQHGSRACAVTNLEIAITDYYTVPYIVQHTLNVFVYLASVSLPFCV